MEHTAFTTLDYGIVIAYLLFTLGIGCYFSRKQKSLEDYFVASRSAPAWAVGLSIIATDLSAISYMGCAAYVYEKDLQFGVGIFLFPIVMLVVIYLFVPLLARLQLFTIYEYLGRRFNMTVRLLASGLFLLIRGGWLSTAIYAQGLALSVITGMPFLWCIMLISGLTALYTVLGGIEAVLWTDVMQFFVLVGGIVVMYVAVIMHFHGDMGEIWRIATEGGHTRAVTPGVSWDDVTLVGLLFFVFVTTLNSYGSDQVIVQRYFATANKKAMTRAVMINGVITVPVTFSLTLLGIGFVAYYGTNPDLALTLKKADQVVPHFVTNVLRPGLSGIVIAGIFAATMSSLSAGFNSLSTATVMDFYRRLRPGLSSVDSSGVRAARLVTLLWAVIGTVVALNLQRLGTILEIMGKINGFIAGPLVALFLLGILSKRANSTGAVLGAALGVVITFLCAKAHMSWLWYAPMGCACTMSLGYTISLLSAAPPIDKIQGLTLSRLHEPELREGRIRETVADQQL